MSEPEFKRIVSDHGYGFVLKKSADPRTPLQAAADNDKAAADTDPVSTECEMGACDE